MHDELVVAGERDEEQHVGRCKCGPGGGSLLGVRHGVCVTRPKLLVIDKLGYLPLLGDGASALFQVINQRYLKSSTVLTTNVGIADWATVFGDATVAAAMPDRLLHRATVIGTDGPFNGPTSDTSRGGQL